MADFPREIKVTSKRPEDYNTEKDNCELFDKIFSHPKFNLKKEVVGIYDTPKGKFRPRIDRIITLRCEEISVRIGFEIKSSVPGHAEDCLSQVLDYTYTLFEGKLLDLVFIFPLDTAHYPTPKHLSRQGVGYSSIRKLPLSPDGKKKKVFSMRFKGGSLVVRKNKLMNLNQESPLTRIKMMKGGTTSRIAQITNRRKRR